MTERQTNRLLGYPEDARLLIINADDFGMCHSVCEAILTTLKDGIVSSTTVMAPCPWAHHAMHMLKENPDIAFGVHLTLVSDFANYRWGPMSSRGDVPSLTNEAGYFYNYDRIPELLARADLAEVELEFRAQIEAVLAEGLKPTHLDWHCLADGGRPGISELSHALALEYGLAMRTHNRPFAGQCQGLGLPTSDHDVLDSYHMGSPSGKSAQFARLLRALPAGLTEWAVHPSLGNEESRALEPENWQIRRADYDCMRLPEMRNLLAEEGIVLINYEPLQKLWAQKQVGS